MALVGILLSSEDNMSLVNFKRSVVVEKLGLKPDWIGDKILELLMYWDNWLEMNFSNIFAMLLIMEIGLSFPMSWRLPPLCKAIMLAVFQGDGVSR